MEGKAGSSRPDQHQMLVQLLDNETAEPRALPLSLLQDITGGFSDKQEIGRGGFAVVYKGILGDRAVAVKRLSDPFMDETKFHREVECLMRVKHENIVRFLGYCADRQGIMEKYEGKVVMADVHQRLLCFEYIPNGNLDKYIRDAHREWGIGYKIIKGICEGLQNLHDNRVVHLDLKPANIMLDDNMTPKITDFGLSRCFDENQSWDITKHVVGTPGYFAPELHKGVITRSLDFYSLGVIIMEIITGHKWQEDIMDVSNSWRYRLGRSKKDAYEQIRICYEIALECKDLNPKKRPESARDIIDRLHEIESIKMNPDMSIETELLVVHPSKLTFTFQQNKLMYCLLHLTNKSDDQRVAFRCCTGQKAATYYHGTLEISGILPPDSSSTYILRLKSQQQRPSNMVALSLIIQSRITLEEDEKDVGRIFETQTDDGIVEVTPLLTVCGPADETTTYEAIPDASAGSPLSEVAQLKTPKMAKELAYAVEATVQVDLFLYERTDFYGKITAHSQLPSGVEVSVLFSCAFKDKVDVLPSSSAWKVPLTRSVVRWHVGSPLLIKVGCLHSVFFWHVDGVHLRAKQDKFFCSSTNTSTSHKGGTTTTPSFEGLEFVFDYNSDKICFANLKGFGYIRICIDDTGKYKEKPNSSLPRSLMRNEIVTDTFKETKFLVIQANRLMPGLLHLTNKSDDKHIVFRCRDSRIHGNRSVIVSESTSLLPRSYRDAEEWELSGILPPDSTSTYLVRLKNEIYGPQPLISLILQSCAASRGQMGVGAIFHNPTKNEFEEVTLRFPEGVSMRIRGWTALFSRPGREIKEVVLKATVSHPSDVSLTSETQIEAPTTESSIDQSVFLDVYPLQPRFHIELNKPNCCPLQLTNRTDEYVIFDLAPYSPHNDLHLAKHQDILPPRSTCTYVLATKRLIHVPASMDRLSIILKSCAAQNITRTDKNISSQDKMPASILKAICDREPIPLKIEILTMQEYPSTILSMDVHPTESWILTGHMNGDVSIWNYQTKAKDKELRISGVQFPGIISAKFIAREKWFVAGAGDGSIHVVTYITMRTVHKFQAHTKSVKSLSVHPNQRFVLSASDDKLIKLWNWDMNPDAEWECVQTYGGHTGHVNYVMFNPYDKGNTFASASEDCKVKIWRTADRNKITKPIAILDCNADEQQAVAYFFMGGRQYIITGSSWGSARVWDLRTNRCIKELEGTQSSVNGGSVVGVVDCAVDNINPVLVTVSVDQSISFLDATTYESRYGKVNFGLREARGFSYVEVEGKRSLVMAFTLGIAIMEMNQDHVNPPATVEPEKHGLWSRLMATMGLY